MILRTISASGIDLLAGEVAALLRKYLILDLDARPRPRAPARARCDHVERIAEARIGIDQQRQLHGIGDRGDRIAISVSVVSPMSGTPNCMLAIPAPVT